MPSTIEMHIFWTSAVLLAAVLTLAPRVCRQMEHHQGSARRNALFLLAAGVAILPILFYPLTNWSPDDSVFGQLFSWFCAHGFIALLFFRIDLQIMSCLKRYALQSHGKL
jgi:hypothetical protein